MTSIVKGGCLCGEIRYEFPREHVLTALHCHCKDCQRVSGSGKVTIVLISSEALTKRGSLNSYTTEGTDGSHVSRGFCPTCGSQVLSNVEELDTVTFIKAGSLDDSSWVQVGTSCWSSSAAHWSPVDSELPAFEKNPDLR
ncbi:aldehyde-activating protein [Microbulbifer agarilyticus]|uniref:Aldehyde-activating protein n=1 Tax=Microbulbifer agarilyticus TaxID=260552 RepID=A0A1Q2M621_9GAMM|nr:GFA family protein [Microbulbifer agarilyticus]AQQ68131.1 aldehyde-activating protein [Microbulbifer agarilyticus]